MGFAALWCLLLAGPTTALEIGGIPFALVWLLRCARFREARLVTWALLRQPLSIVFLAWAAWCALLILRLPEAAPGWKELAAARWAWCLLALPFVGFARSRWIVCIAVGFLCVNVGQLVEAAGHHFNVPALQFKNYPDRLSAWLDPVSGASSMVGAFGLLLPLACLGQGRARVLAIIASVASFTGIIATGSRGAWIAGGMLALIAGVSSLRLLPSRPSGRSLATGAAVIALLTITGGYLSRGIILPRIEYAVSDISRVVKDADYSSDTGLRLFVAREAIDLTLAHPWTGVGPGQFRTQTRAAVDPQDESLRSRVPAHAHNTLLHLAATTGIPGVLLWMTMFALGLRNAWLHASRLGWNTLHAGPFFGLLGMALASGTDVIQLNQQCCAMLFVLLGLSPASPFIFPRKSAPA